MKTEYEHAAMHRAKTKQSQKKHSLFRSRSNQNLPSRPSMFMKHVVKHREMCLVLNHSEDMMSNNLTDLTNSPISLASHVYINTPTKSHRPLQYPFIPVQYPPSTPLSIPPQSPQSSTKSINAGQRANSYDLLIAQDKYFKVSMDQH